MINPDDCLEHIVILGGSTAGWMTAAALSRFSDTRRTQITLIESEEIGTVGVGEATIPQMTAFNRALRIDERDFLAATQGTFKLGIEFVDWAQRGARYFHPFGQYGINMEGVSFHAFWLRLAAAGGDVPPLEDFSICAVAAREGRFETTDAVQGAFKAKFGYAYHIDAVAYAAFLRRYAEERGVTRREGRVAGVQLREDGGLGGLSMEDGATIGADFFVDCTGFAALLIEKALGVGFEDWSRWLPCDRAFGAPFPPDGAAPAPYTRATAQDAGWTWRIPLQHRMGAGIVFSAAHMSDEQAMERLLASMHAPPLREPRAFRFKAGRRARAWEKNCVSIGLAGGFLEPLESTSIYLIQSGISRLLAHFPNKRIAQAEIDSFNAQTALEYERIRDFLILHYAATARDDSAFWRHCRTMELPPSLAARLAVFSEKGRVIIEPGELFGETSWFAVMMGQGLKPRGFDPLAYALDETDLRRRLAGMRRDIFASVAAMRPHAAAIADRASVLQG